MPENTVSPGQLVDLLDSLLREIEKPESRVTQAIYSQVRQRLLAEGLAKPGYLAR